MFVRADLPQTKTVTRCALYARYSSDLQQDKSIDDQFASLQDRARQLGWTVVEEYADRALSGTSLRRESLLRLMDDAKQGKFDVVLAEGLDRISRNQTDSHFFFQSMEFVEVGIYTLADNGFLDAMHVTFRSLQHAQYIKTLGLNVRRGQVGVVRSGRGIGRPPYGYKIVRTIDLVKGRWEIDEEHAEIIRRIYRELAAGKSALVIVRGLNAEGSQFVNGRQKNWSQTQILGSFRRKYGIARNPIYRGEYIWGKTKVRRSPDGSIVAKMTADSDQERFQRPDLRIVDDDLWEVVQVRLKKSGRYPLGRRRRPRHLLSGLLFCGCCQNSYIVGAHDRVRCSGRSEKGLCENRRSILRCEIESAIFDALGGELLRAELIDDYVQEYKAAQERETAQYSHCSKSNQKREALLERERSHLVETITSGKAEGAVGDYILEEIKKRTEELDRIRDEVKSPMMTPLVRDGLEIANRFRSQIANLRPSLSGSSADAIQAREAVRVLLDKVVITPIGAGNKRGAGPVSIEIVGKLCDLVNLSELGPTRSVLLSSKTPTQQNLTNWTWQIYTSIRNDPPQEGRYIDKPHILAALKTAEGPLETRRVLEMVVLASGEEAMPARLKSRTSRIVNCLEYLRGHGAVVMSNVPLARSRQRLWALSQRQGEFWPSGPPMQQGQHIDTFHVFAALKEANALVTSAEIAERVLSAYDDRLHKPPFEEVRLRVRRCLDFHKRRGTIRAISRLGNLNIGWVLTERQQELCPTSSPPEGFADTPGVLAALQKTQKPMTCREIATHMMISDGRKPRSSEIRRLASRIWTCLHYHSAHGTVQEIALSGLNGRSRVWVLTSMVSNVSEYQSTDDARVMSILSVTRAPLIVPEIVKSLLSLRGDPVTERNVRLTTARVQGYLRRFRAQGIARELPPEVKRFHGWVLTGGE
jgi:site-specific DNA recombinase